MDWSDESYERWSIFAAEQIFWKAEVKSTFLCTFLFFIPKHEVNSVHESFSADSVACFFKRLTPWLGVYQKKDTDTYEGGKETTLTVRFLEYDTTNK